MSTKTKKTTTTYEVHTSDDEKCKSLKPDCTTKKLAEKKSSVNGMTHNLCCLEGFIYGHHD